MGGRTHPRADGMGGLASVDEDRSGAWLAGVVEGYLVEMNVAVIQNFALSMLEVSRRA